MGVAHAFLDRREIKKFDWQVLSGAPTWQCSAKVASS